VKREEVPAERVADAVDAWHKAPRNERGLIALDDLMRYVLAAVLPADRAAERAAISASLRRAAEGRREYAKAHPAHDEIHKILIASATGYESAARIIDDPRNVMDVVPSWRWTDDELASLYPEQGESR
jgi:hypothetical protein